VIKIREGPEVEHDEECRLTVEDWAASGGPCFVRGQSSIIFRMTEKEMVLKTVRELPDDCSIDEIADRIEFLAAVQKGFDQLDRGEGIPHDEIKRQLASWLTS